jgi:hypothetical protein
LLSQRGHDAVSFSFRTNFILAPQDGHSKLVRRFIFSTTTGFVRAWLKKLWRGLWWVDTEFCHLGSKGGRSVN